MKNLARVAEVWLDDFAQIFYRKCPEAKHIPGGCGDLSSRIELRRRLQAKLDNKVLVLVLLSSKTQRLAKNQLDHDSRFESVAQNSDS